MGRTVRWALFLLAALGACSREEDVPRQGVRLPEPVPFHPIFAGHPSTRWLTTPPEPGLVRLDGENWVPAGGVEKLSFRQTLRFGVKPDMELPNGSKATAELASTFLSRMSSRLVEDARTRGLSRKVEETEADWVFSTSLPHEELPNKLADIFPGLLVGLPEVKTGIRLTFREGIDIAPIEAALARLCREGADRLTGLFPEEPVLDGKRTLVIRTDRRIGSVMRLLYRLPVSIGKKDVPFEVGSPEGGLAWFGGEGSGGETGERLLVMLFLHCRREPFHQKGPRNRLISDAGDLSGLSPVLICCDADGDAVAAARKLRDDWKKRGASVTLSVLPRKDFEERLSAGTYDAVIEGLSEGLFLDPRSWWHSRGWRNRTGATYAEADELVERIESTLAPGHHQVLASRLRAFFESARLVRVIRDRPLLLLGDQPLCERVRNARPVGGID